MGKKGKKQNQISEEELAHEAIEAGLKNLIYSDSSLRNYAPLILNNIDYKKVNGFIKEMNKRYSGLSENKRAELLYTGLAKYASEGSILKDATIQTLFDAGQEGKLNRSVLERITDFFKPDRFGGAKYFEKARNTYSDMYDILSQDELAQTKLPELAKAAESMRMYGFLNPVLKNF